MEEIWKDIEGYECLYQVSSYGRVKSLERKVKTINNGTECLKYIGERILKPKINRGGYKVVLLYNQSKRKYITVHRLVANAFIPNPNNYHVINHKDECKTNNIVWVNEDGTIDQEKSNLEWCTQEYNANYGTAIERKKKDVYQFTTNGELVAKHKGITVAAESVNGVGDAVGKACHHRFGKKKTNVYKGYIWSFNNELQ